MKERLQKNDIIDAMKDGGTRKINFDYFSQMFFTLQNLNLVYQSCHDRDKKCPCTCKCKSRECNINCICDCPSIDESKVFIPEKTTFTENGISRETSHESGFGDDVEINGSNSRKRKTESENGQDFLMPSTSKCAKSNNST